MINNSMIYRFNTLFKAVVNGNWNVATTWNALGQQGAYWASRFTPIVSDNATIEVGKTVSLTQNESCATLTFPEQHTIGVLNESGFALTGQKKLYKLTDNRINSNPIYTPQTITNGYVSTASGVKTTATDKDFIIYCKGKLNDASSFFHFNLYNTGGGLLYQISFGYDWVSSTNNITAISIKEVSTATTYKFGDVNLSTSKDIVVWYDSKWKYFNVYIDDQLVGSWSPTSAQLLTVSACSLASNASASFSSDIDYWYTGKPNVMVIGDSITTGAIHHAANPAQYAGVDDFENNYFRNLGIRMRVLGFRNYFIVNRGVNGDQTLTIKNRFTADVVNNAPSFVFIHGGINDWATHANPVLSCQYKTDMYTSAVTAGITAYILGVMPTGISNAISAFAIALDTQEQTSYNTYKYIRLFKLMDTNNNGLADSGTLEADNIHPVKNTYINILEPAIENAVLN